MVLCFYHPTTTTTHTLLVLIVLLLHYNNTDCSGVMITVLASILEDQCSEEVTAVDQHRSWISSKGAKGNFEGGINEYLIQTMIFDILMRIQIC